MARIFRTLPALTSCLALVSAGPLLGEVLPGASKVPPSRLFWWGEASALRWSTNHDAIVALAPVATPGFPWKQAVVSWNLPSPWPATVEARPVPRGPTQDVPWYVIARWSADPAVAPRTSVPGQRDRFAFVDTDILQAHEPAAAVEVRLVFTPGLPASDAPVRLGVSLLGAEASEPRPTGDMQAWGRTLPLPVRSQADYPEGIHSWCSPTSLTMILAYWQSNGGSASPGLDVRPVASAVHDPGWGGTGNWPFNTAFAGQQRGLAASVARLGGVGDLEHWIRAGLPVAVSVSYAQLKGAAEAKPGDGHLVVVSGFTRQGDVHVHDPGVSRERVARVFARADFERAWDHSSRTAYLVWPIDKPLPASGSGRWPSR